MRKATCIDIHGISVEHVHEEFNERREELGIADEAIISINVRDALRPMKIYVSAEAKDSTVIVTIFCWADHDGGKKGGRKQKSGTSQPR